MIMAVALAQALGTKGVTHSVDARHSVYRQIYKEWNKIEGSSLEINTY